MFKIGTRLVVSLLFTFFVLGIGVGVISSQPQPVQAQMTLEDFVEQMSLGDFIRRLFEGLVGGGVTPTPSPTAAPVPGSTATPSPTVAIVPEPTEGRAPIGTDSGCVNGSSEYRCSGSVSERRYCVAGSWQPWNDDQVTCSGSTPVCVASSARCRAWRSCGTTAHDTYWCLVNNRYRCNDGTTELVQTCTNDQNCTPAYCIAHTATPVPPTATPVPPVSTATPVPPVGTATPVPTPPPGSTATPVPPAATAVPEPPPGAAATPAPAGEAPACDPSQVTMSYSYDGNRVTFTTGGTQGSVHIGSEFPSQSSTRFTNCTDNVGNWPFIKTCTDTGSGDYFWKQTWKTCVGGDTGNCPNSCEKMIPVEYPDVATPTPTPKFNSFTDWKNAFLSYIRGGSSRTDLTELEAWRRTPFAP